MEIDVHGLELASAKIEIMYALEECVRNKELSLNVIHGYNQGHVIQAHLRSNGYIQRMRSQGYNISLMDTRIKGQTRFRIK